MSPARTDLEQLRDVNSIEGMLRGMGVRLKRTARALVCVCPFPDHVHQANPTPSFSVFVHDGVELFKCWGNCNRTGDVFDFAGYMWVPNYDRHTDLVAAIEKLNRGGFDYVQPETRKAEPQLPQWLWREIALTEQVRAYAKSRGISDQVLEEHHVGQLPDSMAQSPYNMRAGQWMAIPSFWFGNLTTVKLRNITKSKFRFMMVPGSKAGVWNRDGILDNQPVLITKSEISAMVCKSFGIMNVCAPTAGENSISSDVRTATILCPVRVYIGDNDQTGRKSGTARAKEYQAELKYPPEQYKDVDQWILADKEAPTIIRRWLE